MDNASQSEYEDPGAKAQKRTFNILDFDGVYPLLYLISLKYAQEPHLAEEKLGSVYALVYDKIIRLRSLQ